MLIGSKLLPESELSLEAIDLDKAGLKMSKAVSGSGGYETCVKLGPHGCSNGVGAQHHNSKYTGIED